MNQCLQDKSTMCSFIFCISWWLIFPLTGGALLTHSNVFERKSVIQYPSVLDDPFGIYICHFRSMESCHFGYFKVQRLNNRQFAIILLHW